MPTLWLGVGDDRQGGGVDDGVGTGGVVSGQEGGVVDVGQDVDGRGGAADLGQRQDELDGGLVGAERVGQGRGAGEGLAVGTRVEVGLAVRREGDVVVVAAIGSEDLVAGQGAPVRVQPDRGGGADRDGRFQREDEVAAGEPAVELIAGRRRSGYGETVGRGPVGERPVEGQRADDGGRRHDGFGDLVGNAGIVIRQEDLIVDVDVGGQGVRRASEQR